MYNGGMTTPAPGQNKTGITRPAIGVLVDPAKLIAARRSAMLERIELAHLSQALELRAIAAEHDVPVSDEYDPGELRLLLAGAGIDLDSDEFRNRPIGVSRDAIAKLENRERKRPKITTLRLIITALNHERAKRDKPPIDVEDLELAPATQDMVSYDEVPHQQASLGDHAADTR